MYLIQYSTSSAIKNKIWITRSLKSETAAKQFVSQLLLDDEARGVYRCIKMLGENENHKQISKTS